VDGAVLVTPSLPVTAVVPVTPAVAVTPAVSVTLRVVVTGAAAAGAARVITWDWSTADGSGVGVAACTGVGVKVGTTVRGALVGVASACSSPPNKMPQPPNRGTTSTRMLKMSRRDGFRIFIAFVLQLPADVYRLCAPHSTTIGAKNGNRRTLLRMIAEIIGLRGAQGSRNGSCPAGVVERAALSWF
jgi:hypothetical protein